MGLWGPKALTQLCCTIEPSCSGDVLGDLSQQDKLAGRAPTLAVLLMFRVAKATRTGIVLPPPTLE